jgi:hypothetical protein
MAKRIAVLIKDKERQYEGLRTSLGLLLEEHEVTMFVLKREIALSEEFLENQEFVDEMGGARYSDNAANVERHGFQPVEANEMVRLLSASDVVIPF